jgi:hypothetical protein
MGKLVGVFGSVCWLQLTAACSNAAPLPQRELEQLIVPGIRIPNSGLCSDFTWNQWPNYSCWQTDVVVNTWGVGESVCQEYLVQCLSQTGQVENTTCIVGTGPDCSNTPLIIGVPPDGNIIASNRDLLSILNLFLPG